MGSLTHEHIVRLEGVVRMVRETQNYKFWQSIVEAQRGQLWASLETPHGSDFAGQK